MGKSIKLFMWGYQPHFRITFELRAKRVIQSIAPSITPKCFLVGVKTLENTEDHPVCVEPEDEGWNPKIFFNCADRTEEIFKDHPDHNMFYGDEPRMRDKPENIRRKSVCSAVEEVLLKYDSEHKTSSFCGIPTKIEGYYVVPVLQFVEDQLLEYPYLPKPVTLDRYSAPISLLRSVIDYLLEESTAVLEKKEPGRFDAFPTDNTDILRKAAGRFCNAITLSTGDVFLQRIFENLNEISIIPYEGGATIGSMLFCSSDNKQVNLQMQLEKKIPITNHKLARKVIEISNKDLFCVCCGSEKIPGFDGGIIGFGNIESNGEDDVFRIDFVGRHEWDMYYGNDLLMRVAYGVPYLPLNRIDEEVFRTNLKRLVPSISDDGEKRILDIVKIAIEQKKGTMVVITTNASDEAKRLKKQSLMIEPVKITANLIARVSGIDGAILLDEKGVCYAIGVILDGKATDEGDPSRGARYNSAIRYIASNGSHPTICIVVSEDGHINIMPKLYPQIDKKKVDQIIENVKSDDTGIYNKALHWLDDNRFYITKEQCDIVNTELERINNLPLEMGEMRFVINQFVPNQKMNDSYYI